MKWMPGPQRPSLNEQSEVQSRTIIWHFSITPFFMMKASKYEPWEERGQTCIINVFVLILRHLKLAPVLRHFFNRSRLTKTFVTSVFSMASKTNEMRPFIHVFCIIILEVNKIITCLRESPAKERAKRSHTHHRVMRAKIAIDRVLIKSARKWNLDNADLSKSTN